MSLQFDSNHPLFLIQCCALIVCQWCHNWSSLCFTALETSSWSDIIFRLTFHPRKDFHYLVESIGLERKVNILFFLPNEKNLIDYLLLFANGETWIASKRRKTCNMSLLGGLLGVIDALLKLKYAHFGENIESMHD